jgi:hypothetical protein
MPTSAARYVLAEHVGGYKPAPKKSRPTRSGQRSTQTPGRVRTVTPEAFEEWVGERFISLGYAVLRTPFRGDHGIDLNVERQGEQAIVQCKHGPARAVGEPVLRDLYGTLHHSGAQAAYLVTTGSATPAARTWARDKPIVIWDWPYLVERWSAEIAEIAARTSGAAEASPEVRPGWFIYVDSLNTPWAIKLPKSIGEHPLLGFQPLRNPNLEVLPKLVKVRHVNLWSTDWPDGKVRNRSVPSGTEPQRLAVSRSDLTLELPTIDGRTATWHFGMSVGETGAFNPRVRKRRTGTTTS